MSESECIHGLGPVSACTVCNGRQARETAAEASRAGWHTFPARYPSQCPGCNLPIREGDLIRWREGERAHHPGCEP